MYHCTECDMAATFCLARLNDPTITGCTQKDFLEGRIPWNEIIVEHTITKESKDGTDSL